MPRRKKPEDGAEAAKSGSRPRTARWSKTGSGPRSLLAKRDPETGLLEFQPFIAEPGGLGRMYAQVLPKRLRTAFEQAAATRSEEGLASKIALLETLVVDKIAALTEAEENFGPGSDEAQNAERALRSLIAEYRDAAKIEAYLTYQRNRTVSARELEAFVAALQAIIVRNVRDEVTLNAIRRDIVGLMRGTAGAEARDGFGLEEGDSERPADPDEEP